MNALLGYARELEPGHGGIMQNITIEEILSKHTLEDLSGMAEFFGEKLPSKAKKQAYVDKLSVLIADKKRLRELFLVADEAELAQLERALNGEVFVNDEQEYAYWRSVLIVFVTGAGEVVVPKEIREEYTSLSNDTEYVKQRELSDVLEKYLAACTNLYGMIDVKSFLEIFNAQTGRELTESELDEWMRLKTRLRGGRLYFMQDGCILSDIFSPRKTGMAIDYHELMKKQGDMAYYVPEAKELLAYSDKYYVEKNESYSRLEEFFCTEMELDPKKAQLFASHIQLVIRHGGMPRDIVEELNNYGMTFTDSKQLNDFVKLMMDMYHESRMPEKRGHTAEELGEPAATREMIQSVFEAVTSQKPIIKSKIGGRKIYPNEPCPCGSGLKYKNCCGKKNSIR